MGISHFLNPILSFFLCKSCSACCNGGDIEFVFLMSVWGYIFFIRVAQFVYFLNERCPSLWAAWWEAVRLLEVVLCSVALTRLGVFQYFKNNMLPWALNA